MPQASSGFEEGSLGHLLVEIGLNIEKRNDYGEEGDLKSFPPIIDVEAQVHSASEYSSVYPCEVVTRANMFHGVHVNVEHFHMVPGHDGLIFFGDDYKNTPDDARESAAKALLHQFQHHYSDHGVEVIEYHVFENQRRVFLEWGSRHLLSFERTAYTDESGSIACPFNNHDVKFNPPKGYEWRDDSKDQWLVDKEYTNTDEEGWVYGIDFGYIMQNLRAGRSTTTSQLRSVRRRRWKRIAVGVSAMRDIAVEEGKSIVDVSENTHIRRTVLDGSAPDAKNIDETFHVFYNQRRSVFSFSFGPNNLFPTDRHAFTDETGQRFYANCKHIEDISPPTGYKWADNSKWDIDKNYTKTDEFGWSYG